MANKDKEAVNLKARREGSVGEFEWRKLRGEWGNYIIILKTNFQMVTDGYPGKANIYREVQEK